MQDILWKDLLIYKGRTFFDQCTVNKVLHVHGGKCYECAIAGYHKINDIALHAEIIRHTIKYARFYTILFTSKLKVMCDVM